jgi:hypothetical protein
MDPADMPLHKASFWAVRVVLSGVILMVIFGFISYKLALLWLKEENDAV